MAYSEKITFEINLDKVDKNAVRSASNGTWLKMTIVPTPDNKYNEYLISQYVKGGQGEILGNGNDLNTVLSKISGGGGGSQPVPTSMQWEGKKGEEPLPF